MTAKAAEINTSYEALVKDWVNIDRLIRQVASRPHSTSTSSAEAATSASSSRPTTAGSEETVRPAAGQAETTRPTAAPPESRVNLELLTEDLIDLLNNPNRLKQTSRPYIISQYKLIFSDVFEEKVLKRNKIRQLGQHQQFFQNLISELDSAGVSVQLEPGQTNSISLMYELDIADLFKYLSFIFSSQELNQLFVASKTTSAETTYTLDFPAFKKAILQKLVEPNSTSTVIAALKMIKHAGLSLPVPPETNTFGLLSGENLVSELGVDFLFQN
jgi:hypothetical protein